MPHVRFSLQLCQALVPVHGVNGLERTQGQERGAAVVRIGSNSCGGFHKWAHGCPKMDGL